MAEDAEETVALHIQVPAKLKARLKDMSHDHRRSMAAESVVVIDAACTAHEAEKAGELQAA